MTVTQEEYEQVVASRALLALRGIIKNLAMECPWDQRSDGMDRLINDLTLACNRAAWLGYGKPSEAMREAAGSR